MEPLWRIQLLGDLRVDPAPGRDGESFNRFRSRKAALLLAYLAYHRQPIPRETLVEQIWPPNRPEEGAAVRGREEDLGRLGLSVALTSLRRQLEPPGVPAGAVIASDRTVVRLAPGSFVTDVLEFERAIAAADTPKGRENRVQSLMSVVQLYTGPLLPGYYESWVITAQARLESLFFAAQRRLLGLLINAGDFSRAIQIAERGVEVDPDREEACCDLMRVYFAAGESQIALARYSRLEEILEAEGGTKPSAAARQLRDAIARSQSESSLTSAILSIPEAGETGGVQTARRSRPSPRTSGLCCLLLAERTADPAGEKSLSSTILPDLEECGGWLLDATAFAAGFSSAEDALGCALALQRRSLPGEGDSSGQVRLALDVADLGSHAEGAVRAEDAAHTGGAAAGQGVLRPLGSFAAERPDRGLPRARAVLEASHPGQLLCSERFAIIAQEELSREVELVDLGTYWLGDAPRLERLYQINLPGLGPGAFPLLQAPRVRVNNLPVRHNRFFGRQRELEELGSLLTASENPDRLITLTGPGGCGKTRLSIELVSRVLQSWSGAVWFAACAPARDPEGVLKAVADSLHVLIPPGRDLEQQVIEALNRQPTLLVLDNLEQVAAASAPVVGRLLDSAPGLSCIVTSRQLLGLEREREYPIFPLDTPGPENRNLLRELAQWPSVQLFVNRAQAVMPHFQITPHNAAEIAAICRRLDGIPLALELAAAWAPFYPPSRMLEVINLDTVRSRRADTEARHRTLRAAMDWSCDLLSPELRRFFAALSVFRGGCTLDAAEEVCGTYAVGGSTLESLIQLRECSLILVEPEAEEVRYRMLETVRDYAAEKLGEMGSVAEELCDRHAAYCLKEVEDAVHTLRTSQEAAGVRRLAREWANLKAALDWSSASERKPLAARLALEIGILLQRQGYGQEAVRALRTGLDAAREEPGESTPLYAALLRELAGVEGDRSEWREARDHAREALDLFVALQDSRGQAQVYNLLGQAAWAEGDFAVAEEALQNALHHFQIEGDSGGAAMIYNNLGLLQYQDPAGDPEAAAEWLRRAMRLREEMGDFRGTAETLMNLGAVAYQLGQCEKAWSHYLQALCIEERIEHRPGVGMALVNLSEVALVRAALHREQREWEAAQQDQEQACRLAGAAARILEDTESPARDYASRMMEGALQSADLPPDRADAIRAELGKLPLQELREWAVQPRGAAVES